MGRDYNYIITECRSVLTYGSWQTVMYVIHAEGEIEQVFSTFNCYTSPRRQLKSLKPSCLQHATRTDDFGT